jgi:hypothetical protein
VGDIECGFTFDAPPNGYDRITANLVISDQYGTEYVCEVVWAITWNPPEPTPGIDFPGVHETVTQSEGIEKRERRTLERETIVHAVSAHATLDRATYDAMAKRIKSDTLGKLLQRGDRLRIDLGAAEKGRAATPGASPADGTDLRAWVEDCQQSIRQMLGDEGETDLRMHGGDTQLSEDWRGYVSPENANAYSTALRYIHWLRFKMASLDKPGSAVDK